MQPARQANLPAKYATLEQSSSEQKLTRNQRVAHGFAIAMVFVGVAWIMFGVIQGIAATIPGYVLTIPWVLYALVLATIGAALWYGIVTDNKLVALRYHHYRQILKGTIIGLIFDEGEKDDHIVWVVVKGKNRTGDVRSEAVPISDEQFRENGYTIGSMIRFK